MTSTESLTVPPTPNDSTTETMTTITAPTDPLFTRCFASLDSGTTTTREP